MLNKVVCGSALYLNGMIHAGADLCSEGFFTPATTFSLHYIMKEHNGAGGIDWTRWSPVLQFFSKISLH